jgi:hypothetical protein
MLACALLALSLPTVLGWAPTSCGPANQVTRWTSQVDPSNVLPEYPRWDPRTARTVEADAHGAGRSCSATPGQAGSTSTGCGSSRPTQPRPRRSGSRCLGRSWCPSRSSRASRVWAPRPSTSCGHAPLVHPAAARCSRERMHWGQVPHRVQCALVFLAGAHAPPLRRRGLAGRGLA